MNDDSGDGDDEDFFIFNSGDIDLDSDEDFIIDSGLKERIAEEAFFLSSDRLYIIFDPISVDKVSVRAYDCSNKEDVTAAHILQEELYTPRLRSTELKRGGATAVLRGLSEAFVN